VCGYASHQASDDVSSEKKKYNQGGERVETIGYSGAAT
jgi:hypothetical protein